MLNIERIHAPSVEDFQKKYLKANKPVIITGVTDKWPAYEKWQPNYLSVTSGDRKLPINRVEKNNYMKAEKHFMTMADYLKSLNEDNSGDSRLYLSEIPLAKHIPELEADIRPSDELFNQTESNPISVIYVGQEMFSQLHFHPYGSATLCPLYGEKIVRLFAPDQTPYLYKYPWYTKSGNMSKTTELNPDSQLFPLFAKAKYIEITLKKGEMLFIPIYWWHSVQNGSLNIAAVIFWFEKRFNRLPPRYFIMDYLTDLAKDIKDKISRIPNKLKKIIGVKSKS